MQDSKPNADSSTPDPRRMLITAGPTHEAIDAVRYLANRSSGRMGVALAEAAAARGWAVTLLLGPVPRTPSISTAVQIHRFQSTAELQQLLDRHWPEHDVLIMAAAVADYRPAGGTKAGKLPRGDGNLVLELEPTPDLLAGCAATSRDDQTLIGFALAPSDQLSDSALRKLRSKSVHAIVANPLQSMDSESVDATVYLAAGSELSPGRSLPKGEFAGWLLDQLPAIDAARAGAG